MSTCRTIVAIALAFAAGFWTAAATAAETLRNPPGTPAPPTTMRNPPGGERALERSGETGASALAAAPTRTPLGSDPAAPPSRASFGTSGPTPVFPQSPSPGTVGVGASAPSALNPAGASGSTTPAPLTGTNPNGGTVQNGSKAAPLQANGVRKVD